MTIDKDDSDDFLSKNILSLQNHIVQNKQSIIKKLNERKINQKLLFIDKFLKNIPKLSELYEDLDAIYGPPINPDLLREIKKSNQETLNILRKRIAIDYVKRNKQKS